MSILKEILGGVDTAKEDRKKLAARSFAFFCQYYLSSAFGKPFAEYQDTVVDIVGSQVATATHIRTLKRFIKKQHHVYLRRVAHLGGILDIEPRDHGKSTRMSQALPLWLALASPDQGCSSDGKSEEHPCNSTVFPVITGASKEKATDFLDYIKFELENNERILEDYGLQKGRIWKKNKIVLLNGNAIAAVGANEAIRGIKDKSTRPTHIICDDLLKDREVNSRTSRENLYKWFKRVIMNLGKDALIVIVNTIMHPDDLPSRLLNEIKEGAKLKNWIGLRFSAVTPDGKPLWPERWTLEEIEKKRVDLGSHIFATEWENDPLPDEERKFREEWFQGFEPHEIRQERLKIVMAVDPATGKDTGDFSAIVVAGQAENGQIYVLDAEGDKISDMKLIARIIDKYRAWKPERIVFETVAFQEIYKNQMLREALREGLVLPVKGVKQSSNKEFRISKLSPLVEAGIILFKKAAQTLLLEQLGEFPKGHDDVPDALEMAVSELIVTKKPAPSVHSLGIARDTKTIFKGYGRYGGIN